MTDTLAELLRRAAAANPDAEAVTVDGGDRLSYGEWARRSAAQALGLRRSGVAASDVVALIFDARRWTDHAVAYVAAQIVGAVPLPLSLDLSSLEIARALRHTGATAIVAPAGSTLPAWVASGGTPLLDPQVLEAAGGAPGATADASTVGAPRADDRPGDIRCVSRPLAPPQISARPSSVVLAGDSWLAVARASPWSGALLHAQPVGARAGQTALLAALREHVPVVALRAFDAGRVAELVDAGSIGACVLHPALAEAVVATAAARGLDLSRLAVLVLSPGDPPADVADRLRAALPRATVVLDAGPLGPSQPDPRHGGSPVSTAQEGMLWHELFTPGCQNLPGLARRLEGPLDAGALDRALAEIVRRHRPLRTTHELRDGQLRQRVHPPPPSVLAIGDLSSLDPAERAAEVDRVVATAGRQPFDLAEGPIFEPRLLRLGTDDHVLVIRTHHLAFDEWSVGVFRRELGALYGAFTQGRSSPLPEPVAAFDDVAARRRADLAGPEGLRQLEFWRRELAGAPLVTQLPVGDPALPPGTPQPAGGPLTLTLSTEVGHAVRELAQQRGATVFMTLLAAVGVLTGRAIGSDDLLLSTVVANRNRADLHDLIGSFAKKVPLRLRLDGDPTFLEVLARTRRALVGAISAQDLPFEALVQDVLGPAAARHGLAPHPAVLVQAVSAGPPLDLAGLTTAGLDTARRARVPHFMGAPATSPAPVEGTPWGAGLYCGTFVNLSLDDADERLTCTARGAFFGPAVRALLDDLGDLVAAITADPTLPLSRIGGKSRTSAGASPHDVVDVSGFHVEPRRIEEALRVCPGVHDVAVRVERAPDGAAEIVADVVADDSSRDRALTPQTLRAHLWSRLPGYAWPARMNIVPRGSSGGATARRDPGATPGEADQTDAALLTAFHRDAAGAAPAPDAYWQSFPFLEALCAARDAGVVIPARLATRNRTIQALATAMAAERRRGP